jgi:SAM-dependent methyltransferase
MKGKPVRYFDPLSAAQRYAKGRPYFHPLVIDKIATRIGLQEPLARALDVACGTGLSCLALKSIARQIVGVDASSGMIANASPEPHVSYAIAAAEHLPLKAHSFDLLTVSSAFHWLNREAFLAEARRLLRTDGWLIVYDNYFTARMEENGEFESWLRGTHIQKYPTPPRHYPTFGEEDARLLGFQFVDQERYENRVQFTVDTLIDYLVTQSNVIAAVEGGNESISDVNAWLRQQITPLFKNLSRAAFIFAGPIWYLKKYGNARESEQ